MQPFDDLNKEKEKLVETLECCKVNENGNHHKKVFNECFGYTLSDRNNVSCSLLSKYYVIFISALLHTC